MYWLMALYRLYIRLLLALSYLHINTSDLSDGAFHTENISSPAGADVVGRRESRHVGGVEPAQTKSPGLLGKCLLALDHLPVNLVEMYLTDLVHNILVVKSNEAKASVSVRDFVVSQHRFFNLKISGCELREGKYSHVLTLENCSK